MKRLFFSPPDGLQFEEPSSISSRSEISSNILTYFDYIKLCIQSLFSNNWLLFLNNLKDASTVHRSRKATACDHLWPNLRYRDTSREKKMETCQDSACFSSKKEYQKTYRGRPNYDPVSGYVVHRLPSSVVLPSSVFFLNPQSHLLVTRTGGQPPSTPILGYGVQNLK